MIIKNLDQLAVTPLRRAGLEILNAGLEAILTERVLRNAVRLEGDLLAIKDERFDLTHFQNIYLIGFGKAACDAAATLGGILGPRLAGGRIIDIKDAVHAHAKIRVYRGTHPKPSPENVRATREVLEFAKSFTERDLVLTVVSGGGSALLCASSEECGDGQRLYEEFLRAGGTIKELNLVRRHVSTLKGGGLAKALYPATMIGLIFCDIPGGECGAVASGPTYYDESTIDDARAVLQKYNFSGYTLNETSKDKKYFEKVTNLAVVSNNDALAAMAHEAEQLGFRARILGNAFYDPIGEGADLFARVPGPHEAVFGGGEPRLVVPNPAGQKGGRNTQFALEALARVGDDELVIGCASDGMDNTDAAGAIADSVTRERAREKNLDVERYRAALDSYSFFERTGDLIFTGPTGANVADLMVSLRV